MSGGWGWIREGLLAIGLIGLLVCALWVATGSLPPMVVVESSSMMHAEEGEVGAIDPGDLILVMSTSRRTNVITYAEAADAGNRFEGWSSHGDLGDVIIYSKNGGSDTPVIHRAMLEAVANGTLSPTDRERGLCPTGASWDPISLDATGEIGTCVLTWDAPGTDQLNVEKINWTFESYTTCPSNPHGLMVQGWDPGHSGFLTLGDHNRCDVDQGQAAYPLANGLTDENGNPVQAVRSDWLVGVAGAEIPWLGTVKLAASSNSGQVTTHSWQMLGVSAVVLLLGTYALERVTQRLMSSSPEVAQATLEESIEGRKSGGGDDAESGNSGGLVDEGAAGESEE
jgi:signal peptidase I